MAFEGWYGYENLKSQKLNSDYKKFFKALEKITKNDDNVYISTSADFTKSSKSIEIKITDKKLLDTIMKNTDFVSTYGLIRKTGSDIIKSTPKSGVNINFVLSGGNRGTGKLQRFGVTSKVPSTAQQESGTILWLQAKLANKTPDLEKICQTLKFEFDEEWVYNFEEQWKAFENFFGSNLAKIKNHQILLDSAKNDSDVIVDLAKKFGLKDAKDNWNPADIWLMGITSAKIKKETENFVNLNEYNHYLEEKFKTFEIIGVSLKKVSKGSKGHWVVIDKQNLPEVNLKPSRVVYNKINSNFIFETSGIPKGFNIRVGTKAGSVKSDSDIKFYAEGRMSGTSVQLGAISAQFLDSIYKDYKYDKEQMKTKIFQDPIAYFEKYEKEILKNSAVVNTSSEADLLLSLLDYKVAAYLAFNIKVFLSFSDETLKSLFFSASKLSEISSIHLKIY